MNRNEQVRAASGRWRTAAPAAEEQGVRRGTSSGLHLHGGRPNVSASLGADEEGIAGDEHLLLR